MDVKTIIFKLLGYRASFSGEPPFRVCSKWLWANLLFGINRNMAAWNLEVRLELELEGGAWIGTLI